MPETQSPSKPTAVGEARASQYLTKSVSDTAKKTSKQIVIYMGCNLELMAVVQNTILDYKQQKEIACAQSLCVTDLITQTIASRKRKKQNTSRDDDEPSVDDADGHGDLAINFDKPLRRGLLTFSNWTRKLLADALRFFDPQVLDAQTCRNMSVKGMLQSFEFATDIKATGDDVDRVGTDEKRPLFESVKVVYDAAGRRFQYLEVSFSTGEPNWPPCSPWSIVKQSSDPVTVDIVLKEWAAKQAHDGSKSGPLHLTFGASQFFDDAGPLTTINPWSLKQAALQSESTSETYGLLAMVPNVRRKLCHRTSDEVGATNLSRKTGQMHRDEVASKDNRETEKKAAKLAGSRVLGQKKVTTATSPENETLPDSMADSAQRVPKRFKPATTMVPGLSSSSSSLQAKASAPAPGEAAFVFPTSAPSAASLPQEVTKNADMATPPVEASASETVGSASTR